MRALHAEMLDGPAYLFDNLDDPYRTDNRGENARHAATRDRLLQNWMHEEALGDPFKPTTWYRGAEGPRDVYPGHGDRFAEASKERPISLVRATGFTGGGCLPSTSKQAFPCFCERR